MIALACLVIYPLGIATCFFVVFAFWTHQNSEMDKALEEMREYIKRNKEVFDKIKS